MKKSSLFLLSLFLITEIRSSQHPIYWLTGYWSASQKKNGGIFTDPSPNKPIASWELDKEVGAIFLTSNLDDLNFDGKKSL